MQCLIGAGGNVGSVKQTIMTALDQLAERGCEILHVSRFYRSAPMGPDAGPEFVNAAVRVRTALSPHELLRLLQRIENESGRIRSRHWGPRTLDLDLLCYGRQHLSSKHLIIPHPGIWYRRFVLEPLCEIASDWQHIGLGLSMEDLRHRLESRPLRIEVVADDLPQVRERHKDLMTLQLLTAETAECPVEPEVFCRFVSKQCSPQGYENEFSFVLTADAEKLEALVESVADAALGKCEA